MANYRLYILSRYTDMKLSNMDCISIIPDTHVIQCSIKLGIVDEKANSKKNSRGVESLVERNRFKSH